MEKHDPAQEMSFAGDDEEGYVHHILHAVAHKAGLEPHPGKYVPTTGDPSVTELASQHMRELPPEEPAEEKPPVPPQEEISGNGPGESKKSGGKGKSPSSGTPAAVGAKAVTPPEPQGNF